MAREEEQSLDDSQHHSCGKVKHQLNTHAACSKALQALLYCKPARGTKSANVLHDILNGGFALRWGRSGQPDM